MSVEKIPILIGVLSAASLLAGVLFDIGYFSSVSFQYIFYASIQDHIESAIIWAPTILFTVMGVYFSGFASGTFGGIKVVARAKNLGRHHRFITWVAEQVPLILGAFSFIFGGAISSAAYGAEDFSVLIVFSLIFIMGLVLNRFVHSLDLVWIVPRIPAFAALLIVLCGALFYLGQYWGGKDVERAESNPSSFSFTDGSSTTLGVVRPIGAGVIVIDTKSHEVSIIRIENVAKIITPQIKKPTLIAPASSLKILLCRWFGVGS